MGTKYCPTCKTTKPIAEFSKNRTKGDGLGSECKMCVVKRVKKWGQDNPEKLTTWRKAHYQANREKHRAKAKEWYHSNKERAHQRAAAWRATNRGEIKAKKRLDTTGFSPELLQKALDIQSNACAICRCDLSAIPQRQVHADHCHTTGAPRGVLCHHCNVALGYLGDSETALQAAIEYLRHPPLRGEA